MRVDIHVHMNEVSSEKVGVGEKRLNSSERTIDPGQKLFG